MKAIKRISSGEEGNVYFVTFSENGKLKTVKRTMKKEGYILFFGRELTRSDFARYPEVEIFTIFSKDGCHTYTFDNENSRAFNSETEVVSSLQEQGIFLYNYTCIFSLEVGTDKNSCESTWVRI